MKELLDPLTPPDSPLSRSESPVLPTGCKPATVLAMTNVGQHLIVVDSNKAIKVVNLSYNGDTPIPDSVAYVFPAHRDSVQGVRSMPPSAYVQSEFYTWSICGTVIFWDQEGEYKEELAIDLEQRNDVDDDYRNELKVVEVTQSATFFVSGDKFGVLRYVNSY